MLQLRTLGTVALVRRLSGQPKSMAVQPKRLALLIYLARTEPGAFVRRDSLLALFWPESSTEHGRSALRQALTGLRRVLGDGALSTRGEEEVAISPGVLTCDANEFERACARGDGPGALGMYSGDFLEGFHVDRSTTSLDDWISAERVRLRQMAVRAAWIAADETEGSDPAAAVDYARRAVSLAPDDEIGFVRYLTLLGRRGDRAGALHAYDTFRRRLAEHYGVEPAPETQAIVAALRSRQADGPPDPVVTPAAPESDLPAAAPPGRSTRVIKRSDPRLLAKALAAGLVLLVVAGSYSAFSARGPTPPIAPTTSVAAPAVAVLPFGVNDPALATWREGAMVVLATDIDGVGGLRAIDAQTVVSLTRVPAAPELTAPPPKTALEIARRAGAHHAVVGNIVAIESSVRITADLYDAESGERFRQLQVEGVPERMFALLDALAVDVVRSVLPRTGRSGAEDLARVEVVRHSTSSLPALKAYLEGEKQYQQSRFDAARDWYERALEADSTFAFMLTRFLVPYSFVTQATPKSIGDPLARALRMLDRLPRREALLVRASSELRQENLAQAYELLRQASNEYPDDYEVWYSLGEVALHRGGDLLLPPDVAIRAFNNSVQLNPMFGPPYHHLIEVTLAYRGDLERTAAINSAYERAAPTAEDVSLGGLALALATGNASTRQRALEVLDTLPLFLVQSVEVFLRHPRFREAQERALAVLAARAKKEPAEDSHPYEVRAFISRGRLAQAAATSLKSDRCAPLTVYWTFLLGLTQLPAEAEAALNPQAASSFSCARTSLFVAGGFAVDRERWSDVDSARANLASAARERSARGDSVNAQQFLLWAEALRGYRLARSGDLDEGIRVLETVQPRLRSEYNEIVRWWLANLLLPNRPRDARRYFDSFWHTFYDVPAAYELARIDERTGHSAEARAAYQRFAVAWRDADPAVQPRVADARARLASLPRHGHR